MKNIVSILFIAFLLTACEKTVDLKYKDNQSRIIIEGNITNGPGPYFVKITKSVRLTETGTYPTVDDAVVTISDDAGNTESLAAMGKGMYSTSTLTGVEGRTYTLTVQAEDETYTAQSTMPQRVPFDSIKVETDIITGETEYSLIPAYKDPLSKGDNYRFVMWLNNKLLNQHLVQNDEVRNGVVNTVRLEINDDDIEFKKGDSITLQMQCIDKNVALYYRTLALISDSGPGGGTTPNNPPNNISNGALGIFSAYTMEEKTTVLP
ncbi:DUF4249 domain-containing protein [Chitinophaga filiformis]|uniref:DUF4249 family protein n=1 Tax=Chitinophaga filiformis TaxID=104663 RepID=UPI001F2F47EF|nr:DUF4249 family protein [Chitinophaga filiformis]MCF6406447.1 DUF4249 domain-containing protein [Chitinophaga filiformis]